MAFAAFLWAWARFMICPLVGLYGLFTQNHSVIVFCAVWIVIDLIITCLCGNLSALVMCLISCVPITLLCVLFLHDSVADALCFSLIFYSIYYSIREYISQLRSGTINAFGIPIVK